MLKHPVYLHSIASISALGITSAEIWANYLHENSLFQKLTANKKEYWVSKFSDKEITFLNTIISSDSKYKHLDKSVVMAILVARKCFENSNFSNKNIGINLGLLVALPHYLKSIILILLRKDWFLLLHHQLQL